MKETVFRLLALLIPLVSCAPASQVAPAPIAQPLNTCFTARTAPGSGPWYALKNGYFARAGLAVSEINVPNGAAAIAALVSGQAQMCTASTLSVIQAARAGEDMVIVASFIRKNPFRLIARKELNTPEKLIGKTIASRDIGGGTDIALRHMLFEMGVDTKAVKTIALPTSQAALAAVLAGAVDAAILLPPETLLAQREGLIEMGAPTPGEFATVVVVAQKSFLASNRPLALAYLKGLTQAIDAQKRDETGSIQILAEYIKLDPIKDAAELKEAHLRIVVDSIASVPRPTTTSLKFTLENSNAAPTGRNVTASDVIDASLIDELERLGVFKDFAK